MNLSSSGSAGVHSEDQRDYASFRSQDTLVRCTSPEMTGDQDVRVEDGSDDSRRHSWRMSSTRRSLSSSDRRAQSKPRSLASSTMPGSNVSTIRSRADAPAISRRTAYAVFPETDVPSCPDSAFRSLRSGARHVPFAKPGPLLAWQCGARPVKLNSRRPTLARWSDECQTIGSAWRRSRSRGADGSEQSPDSHLRFKNSPPERQRSRHKWARSEGPSCAHVHAAAGPHRTPGTET
jgi:hypothetical protein